jgi:hypothetical protein
MRGREKLLVGAAVAVAGCVLGNCGSDDETEIRDVSKLFLRALSHKDGERACELMTMRASVQLRASFAQWQDATGNCENIVRNTRPDLSRASAAAVGKARLTVRGDRAVLRFRGDPGPLGFRRAGDSWRVDNLLNPRVDETPRRRDPSLTRGSDVAQIRATTNALHRAFTKRDHRRICDLIGPGVEAPLLINVLFVRAIADPDGDPSDVTCAVAFKQIEQIAQRRGMVRSLRRVFEGSFVRPLHGNSTVTIRGERATLRVGRFTRNLIKLDGRWLLDAAAAPAATPAAFALCWKRAGARLASDAGDVRFAAADKHVATTRAHGRVSVKGDDWRIFYAMWPDGADPGLTRVLADPLRVPVVAYVRNAATHPKVVRKARGCGD